MWSIHSSRMWSICTAFSLLILQTYFVYSCREKPVLPSITTTSVTEISYTTAVSGGNLIDAGSSSLLKMGLCWSTSPEPTIEDKLTTESLATAHFSSNLTQLIPNTRYYVRAYAANSEGTSYGNQVVFTTNQVDYATLTTTEITKLSSTTAISGGKISTDNGAPVTARGVCWSTVQNPTVDGSKTIDGDGIGTFISSITGLIPGTLYYVRAYATNSAGTSYGNQLTFKTPYDLLLTKENSILSGGSILSTFDGGHIVFGFIYKNIPNSTLTDWLPYIIKLDSLDNRIWETEVSISFITNYQYSDILETKDHKIALCYKSNVVLLDENGNILWKLEYKTDERYGCSSLVESDENNLFVLASDDIRTALIKVSMAGELLWDKVIKDGNNINHNVGHLLCKIDNGNFFLAGYSDIDTHQRIWVAEINSTGDIIWENAYIDTYELSDCSNMIKTNQGGIIITAYSLGNLNERYARVLKLNSQHEIIWEKRFFWDPYSNMIYAIIQDSNGDYIFCGTQGYDQVSAVLVKLNKDGNELWKRMYWPEGETDYSWYLGDLLQTSNGGYILVGNQSKLWRDAHPKGIWVKKVDQSGN